MFNPPLTAGVPLTAPVIVSSPDVGGFITFNWTNTALFQVQIGHDDAGGVAYVVDPAHVAGPGATNIVVVSGIYPYADFNHTQVAVRYVNGGYIGPWSNPAQYA